MKSDKKLRGLIYVGHIPRELDEEYLRKYFEQFGTINRVHMPRSSKTGNYKGYGFIEFANPETAKIAAETMDKYIIDGRTLHVEYRGSNKRLKVNKRNKTTRKDKRQAYANSCMHNNLS